MDKCTTPNGYLSDEEIIELYWTRKENAIDETDKKYGQLLFKIAYNILNDRLDSEECQSQIIVRSTAGAIGIFRFGHQEQ